MTLFFCSLFIGVQKILPRCCYVHMRKQTCNRLILNSTKCLILYDTLV